MGLNKFRTLAVIEILTQFDSVAPKHSTIVTILFRRSFVKNKQIQFAIAIEVCGESIIDGSFPRRKRDDRTRTNDKIDLREIHSALFSRRGRSIIIEHHSNGVA